MHPQPKKGEVRLEGDDYRRFKFALHKLDRWRCKICPFFHQNPIRPLTVSHMIGRAILRRDTFDNAISACEECHKLVTIHAITVEWAGTGNRDIVVIDNRKPYAQ